MFAALSNVACDASPSRPVPEPEPLATRDFAIVNDFAYNVAGRDDTLQGVNDPQISVGGAPWAILAIERPSIDSTCIERADLRLFFTEFSPRRGLAVYPSHVFSAADKREGDPYGYAGALLDIRPRGLLKPATGWIDADIGALVRRWLAGRPFPSLGAKAPRSGEIVVAIRETTNAAPYADATFASSDGDIDHQPHLRISYDEGCTE